MLTMAGSAGARCIRHFDITTSTGLPETTSTGFPETPWAARVIVGQMRARRPGSDKTDGINHNISVYIGRP